MDNQPEPPNLYKQPSDQNVYNQPVNQYANPGGGSRSNLKPLYILLIGCGSIAVVFIIVVVVLFAWLLSGPEGGVKLSNEIDPYATKYLKDHKMLKDKEKVIAYYDATVSMDGTEAIILTDSRILSHRDGKTTAIKLRDIDDIQHTKEGLLGDIYVITAKDGQCIKVEIAPLNSADAFTKVLMNSWNKAKKK
jgi:hypothetical protein